MLFPHSSAALTPPMGWNSYDYYDTTVTEADVRANAEVLARELKPYGWEYVVVDIQWYAKDAGARRAEFQYIPFGDHAMDEYGRFQPDPARFPSASGGRGFGTLADYVHSLGLKFGIHIMRGIPRAAAHRRLPVHGTPYTAADLADPSSICRWNPDMYGVRAGHPGAQAYYDDLIAMYAAWGVDFIKCDDIANTNMYPHAPYSGRAEIEYLHNAILHSGRDIVLSLSPGPALIEQAWHYAQNANMWRITDDLWDKWEDVRAMFDRCELWQDHVAPGAFPDCDMLPLGRIGRGFGAERATALTRDEQRTLVSLWCLFGSPLMLGAELTQLDEFTKSLLTNREVLRLLPPSFRARQLAKDEAGAVWTCTGPAGADGQPERYLALFNFCAQPRTMAADTAAVPAWQGAAPAAAARELWTGETLPLPGARLAANVPPHGVRLYKVES